MRSVTRRAVDEVRGGGDEVVTRRAMDERGNEEGRG